MSNLTNSALQEHARQINQAVAALIQLEAMKAENEERRNDGLSLAYGEDQFINLLSEYGLDDRGIYSKFINIL